MHALGQACHMQHKHKLSFTRAWEAALGASYWHRHESTKRCYMVHIASTMCSLQTAENKSDIYIAQMLQEFANRIGCSNMHSMAALGALTCKAWHHCMGALYARHDGSTGCSNMAALGALIYIYIIYCIYIYIYNGSIGFSNIQHCFCSNMLDMTALGAHNLQDMAALSALYK